MTRDRNDRRRSSSKRSGDLSVGDVVRSTINPEIEGRIVSCGARKVEVELLAWPTPWWETWGKRPVPLLIENLERVAAALDSQAGATGS